VFAGLFPLLLARVEGGQLLVGQGQLQGGEGVEDGFDLSFPRFLERLRSGIDAPDAIGTVGRCDESVSFIATADEWVLVRHLAIDGQRIKPRAVMKPGRQLQQHEPAAPKHEKGLAATATQQQL